MFRSLGFSFFLLKIRKFLFFGIMGIIKNGKMYGLNSLQYCPITRGRTFFFIFFFGRPGPNYPISF